MALIDTRISPCKPVPVESSSSCRTSQSLPDAKEIGEKLQPLGVEMRAETLKGWAWLPVSGAHVRQFMIRFRSGSAIRQQFPFFVGSATRNSLHVS